MMSQSLFAEKSLETFELMRVSQIVSRKFLFKWAPILAHLSVRSYS